MTRSVPGVVTNRRVARRATSGTHGGQLTHTCRCAAPRFGWATNCRHSSFRARCQIICEFSSSKWQLYTGNLAVVSSARCSSPHRKKQVLAETIADSHDISRPTPPVEPPSGYAVCPLRLITLLECFLRNGTNCFVISMKLADNNVHSALCNAACWSTLDRRPRSLEAILLNFIHYQMVDTKEET